MEKTVSFLTDDKLYEKLEHAKIYFQKSKGDILRDALIEYLDKHLPEDIEKRIKALFK
ncbi:MAG: ribbon-helix-helix protein, CopG family [Candidatus Dadabacteria bacterium]|nr:ribbon-helix-helix protein, CopG family [Candidatus Dadabacteria bacterium]NIQ12867.1 ribbon-helix-helix protein, CopG family [Candidatus Dadabacteria bacterium]